MTAAGRIATKVSELLSRNDFLDALPGHLAPDDASQARAPLVLSRLEELARFRGA